MSYLIFDTETSGLPNFKLPADDPSQPRLVQVAAILCDPEGLHPIRDMNMIVKPDGWTIAAEAAAIHGITTERALAEGKPIAEVLNAFDGLVVEAKTLCAFNIRFDNKFIRGERRRLGYADRFGELPEFDVMWACRPLCQLPKNKLPKLIEAYSILLNRDLIGGHRAENDAEALRQIVIELRRRGIDCNGKLPDSFKNKPAAPEAAPAPAPLVPRITPADMNGHDLSGHGELEPF